MTIGQIIESIQSKACSHYGRFADGTPFTDLQVGDVIKDLESTGKNKYGYDIMYNPFTGEKIKSKIFIGPTYYQRLKHMVDDKVHCLTPDHEVLTLTGWKTFSELSKNEKVATLCDDQLIFQYPINIYNYPEFSGETYTIKHIDLEVTNGHRLYIKYKNDDINSNYKLIEAKDLEVDQVSYKTDAFVCDDDMTNILNAWTNGSWSAVKTKDNRWHLTSDLVKNDHIHIDHEKNMVIRNYNGPVWCLQVPGEIFLVRSTKPGSIPVWTGNSRAKGPYQMQTRQPVEGRRQHGGLRFGKPFCRSHSANYWLVTNVGGNTIKLREHPEYANKFAIVCA